MFSVFRYILGLGRGSNDESTQATTPLVGGMNIIEYSTQELHLSVQHVIQMMQGQERALRQQQASYNYSHQAVLLGAEHGVTFFELPNVFRDEKPIKYRKSR